MIGLIFVLFLNFRDVKRNMVAKVRDILIQEIMTLNKSEFEGEAIDMDSVAFAGKFLIVLPGKLSKVVSKHNKMFLNMYLIGGSRNRLDIN